MGEVTIDLEDPSYPIGGTTKAGTKVNPRMEACNSVPTYDGQPVEVGPRARLATFKNFDEKGTFAPAHRQADGVSRLLLHHSQVP